MNIGAGDAVPLYNSPPTTLEIPTRRWAVGTKARVGRRVGLACKTHATSKHVQGITARQAESSQMSGQSGLR